MNLIIRPVIALAVTAVLALHASGLIGQEVEAQIEIVNQDGQPLDAQQLKIQLKQQGDQAEGQSDIKVGEGKIIVLNEDGTKREIDVSGAQSIVVNKSVRSIMKDGEEQKQVQGKAIIIGPDGEKQEIILGDGVELGELEALELEKLPKMLGKLDFEFLPFGNRKLRVRHNLNRGKYMIGVHCESVSDGLRAQLDLSEGIGLIVKSEPAADTPAAKAGIQKHDLLMYADQTALKTVKDLTEVIQAAGKDNASISMTIVRRGKELGVDLTPIERPENDFRVIEPGDGQIQVFGFDEVGPGFIFGDENELPEQFRQQFEKMHQQMQKQMEQMNELHRKMQKQLGNQDDDD